MNQRAAILMALLLATGFGCSEDNPVGGTGGNAGTGTSGTSGDSAVGGTGSGGASGSAGSATSGAAGSATGGAAGGATCPTGTQSCAGSCVDTQSNTTHCGQCGIGCAQGQLCTSGVCTCLPGLTACLGACVDPSSDSANCGVCGNTCPAPQVCSMGTCATTCAPGLTACGTDCVNLTTSNENCGGCGMICPSGQGCENSACACPTGQTLCGGACTNLSSDPANCGACGNLCTTGASCSSGTCMGGGGGAGGNGGGNGGLSGAAGQGGAGSGGLGGSAGRGGAGAGGAGSGGRGGAGAGGSAGRGGAGAGGSAGRGGAGAGGTGGRGGAGAGGTGGSSGGGTYPCNGTTAGYNAVATKSGSTWTVVNGTRQVYSGADMQAALVAAYGSLTSGRTAKQSVLVQGSGDIPASSQVSIPSYTILNVCGTINVSGTPSGSDRSPLYARNARDIEIPNLMMTGAPQYGVFMRGTNNVHLGHIELRLARAAGIGIRVNSGPNASTMTTFNDGLTIDYVYGSGMGSHIVETYGINNIRIGTVEGNDVGQCGLLLNRSINAEIDLVTCTNCAVVDTGYAAFRIANDVGKVGTSYPAGNIHVRRVRAQGGGRGIFSVSGSGGLTIDQIELSGTGGTPILLQNCYNTTIAAQSGTVSGGLVQLSNDTDNTNSGRYPPSQNVAFRNLTLSNGASVRQDWCAQYGSNGCSATNITGGTVSMCP